MNRILRKDFGLAVISFALAIVVSANPAIDSLKSILNNSTGFDRIEILIELSSNYKDENIRESIRYASIATELTEDSGNIILGAKAYNNLGDYYQSIGVYDSAIVAYNRSVELYAQLRNEELSSSVISKIGELSLITGDFSMALDFMIKSLLLKENEGDLDGTGNGYLNVARVLHSINDYDQALEYYLKGLTYFEQVDNKTKIGETLWRIGLIKSLQHNIAEAEENFQQAIVYIKPSGDLELTRRLYVSIADMYFDNANINSAVSFYKDVFMMTKESINDTLVAIYVQLKLGACYGIYLNQPKKGIELANNAINSINSPSGLTLKYEGFDILSNIYEKKGEMQKALNYKVKYSQLKDSLFLKEVEGEYNRLRKLLDLDRVKLAEKDEEIYEVNQILSEAQRTNYLLVALCISLIIAVFLVRVKYRK